MLRPAVIDLKALTRWLPVGPGENITTPIAPEEVAEANYCSTSPVWASLSAAYNRIQELEEDLRRADQKRVADILTGEGI